MTKIVGKHSSWLVYALSVVSVVAVWHVAATVLHAPLILPKPGSVVARLFFLCRTADFWRHTGATFFRVLKAFVFVLILGSAAGVLCGVCKAFAQWLAFPLAVIRAVPVVAFILLALFWLGSDSVPVFCAVLMALPVMITSVSHGFSALDKNVLFMARVFRLNAWQRARYIYIEELAPFFAGGALSSFGMIWKVVAAGEVLSIPRQALGSLMQIAQVHLETRDVLAVSIALVLLSVLTERLFRVVYAFCSKRRGTNKLRVAPDTFRAVQTQAVSVSLADFSLVYGTKKLYEHFDLHLAAGERLGLLAPSGAGKTTLLHALAEQCLCRSERVSVVFQEPRLLLHHTAFQNVLIPLLQELDAQTAESRAVYLLRAVGLGERLQAFPAALSGGERQRLSLARALAFPCDMLLLDEAFQSQDAHSKAALLQLVDEVCAAEPKTVVFITHDVHEAVSLATRILVLDGEPVRVLADRQNALAGTMWERFVRGIGSHHALESELLRLMIERR